MVTDYTRSPRTTVTNPKKDKCLCRSMRYIFFTDLFLTLCMLLPLLKRLFCADFLSLCRSLTFLPAFCYDSKTKSVQSFPFSEGLASYVYVCIAFVNDPRMLGVSFLGAWGARLSLNGVFHCTFNSV